MCSAINTISFEDSKHCRPRNTTDTFPAATFTKQSTGTRGCNFLAFPKHARFRTDEDKRPHDSLKTTNGDTNRRTGTFQMLIAPQT